MEYLPLEVGSVHLVEIHDSEPSDASGGEIERGRRAESAGADDKNLRGQQSLLASEAKPLVLLLLLNSGLSFTVQL